MKEDKIKEIFAKQLKNIESPVSASVWKGVASSIGAGASSATSAGLSLGAKIGIGTITIVGVTSAILLFSTSNNSSSVQPKHKEVTEYTPKQEETNSTKKEKTLLNTTEEEKSNHFSKEEAEQLAEVLDTGEKKETIMEEAHLSPELKNEEEDKTTTGIAGIEGQTSSTNKEEEIPHFEPEPEQEKQSPKKEEATKKEQNSAQKEEITQENTTQATTQSVEIKKLPNVLTLNGDGINDELFLEYEGEFKDFQLVVLDNNNTAVYQTDNPRFRWRGFDNTGNQLKNGTYYYIITGKDSNGNAVQKYSSLNITK